MKTDKSLAVFLQSLNLFSGVDVKVIENAIISEAFKIATYPVGETVYSPEIDEKRLTVFISGEAEVHSTDENRAVILRTLTRGSVIGVANLFSDERYVSRVIAVKKCETLELSASAYGAILESDRRAMYNYISFLSNRICYLNKKIVCLTAGSSERRLAYYLDSALSEQQERGISGNKVTVQMNTVRNT